MNVRGIKKNGHLLIEHHLHKYHIACLQETRFRDLHHRASFEYLVQAKYQAKVFVSDQNSGEPQTMYPRSGGVAIVLHGDFPGFERAQVVDSRTIPNRYLVVRVGSDSAPMYIHNVYAPTDTTEKKRFFESLPTDFEPNADHIVCGDFNTAIEMEVDSARRERRNDSSQPTLVEWLGQVQVSDAWRVHHPTNRVFTGPHPRVNRLDYIFLSEDILCQLYGSSRYFEPRHGGDHLAHEVVLAPPQQLQGRGYWRFPRYLFEYPQVVEAIKREVDDLVPVIEQSVNPGIVWQVWKKRMKSMLQRVCQRIQSEKRQALKDAQDRVDELSRQLCESSDGTTAADVVRTDLDIAREHLRQVIEANSMYNQDTAFDVQAQQTERSTSFFFRPPQAHLRRTPIESVELADGSKTADPNLISVEFNSHWGRVMGVGCVDANRNPRVQDAEDKLLNTVTRTLSTDQRTRLDSELSAQEFEVAIKTLSPHKAPGSDGLTAAFYQIAPSTFAKILHIVFKYQVERGILLPDQRKSSVVLLHKKGSRSHPGNYRPIALLQVDVKIFSRVLTNRLRVVITSLINPDQKGFVRGRSIHHHIVAVRDLQHMCSAEGIEGYATFLDFEKAYDRVRWDYLFKVMRRMNIGDEFVSWVHVLLKDSRVSLMLNGWAQTPFEPTRGVKQGDPLSPLLFLLSLEPMCNLIREHPEHGIQVKSNPSVTATGTYFADDSTLISGSVQALKDQLDLVQEYCEASGARLNQSKCVVLVLNKNQSLPTMPGFRVLADGETVTYLGIAFGRHDTTPETIDRLDRRLYASITMWSRRARTLEGRKLLANSVILSTLWHVAVHVNIDLARVRRWQASINQFILRGFREGRSTKLQLIPSRYLYQDRVDMGLQFPQIQAVLRQQRLAIVQQFVHQVRTITTDSFQWSSVATYSLSRVLGDYQGPSVTVFLWIDPTRTRYELRLKFLSTWWQQTWRQWFRQTWPVNDQSRQYLLRCPVWLSSNPMLRVQQSRSRSYCIGMGLSSHRPFRQWYARITKYSTLQDFVRTDGKWPTQDQFANQVNRLLSQNALSEFDTYVQLLPIRPKIVRLYSDLTTLIKNLYPDIDLDNHEFETTSSAIVPVCGVQVGSKVFHFPNIPSKFLREVTRHIPTAQKPHPVLQHIDTVSEQDAFDHLEFFGTCRKYMLPVIHDTMLRLLYRGLPTRSKFWFLQATCPDIVCCEAPRCNGVETEEHLLFQCRRVQEVWTALLPSWNRLVNRPIAWRDVILGLRTSRGRLSQDQVDCLKTLWMVFCSVILQHIWRTRNFWVFEGRQLPPSHISVKIILSVFASHLRFVERLWSTSQAKTEALKWFRTNIRQLAPYRAYYQEHPILLQQRLPVFGRCWYPTPRHTSP